MNRRYLVGLLLGIILSSASTFAQDVSMNSAPAGFQPAYVVGEDTFAIVNLPGVYIFPEMKFKNKKTACHRCFFYGLGLRGLFGLIGLLPLAMYQPDQVA